jgi:hypothetical protein
MGRFHGPCEHFTYELPFTPSFFCLFKIEMPFALEFHVHFTSIFVVTFQILLIFLGQKLSDEKWVHMPTLPKLCITSSCSNWENKAFIYTQRCLITTFVLSKKLHCIDSTCKVVHLVMVLRGMNYC